MKGILNSNGQIPDIDTIAEADARVVVDGYFNQEKGGWVGNALFDYFGTNGPFQTLDPSTSPYGTYDLFASMYSMQQALPKPSSAAFWSFLLSDNSPWNLYNRTFVMNNNSAGGAQTLANLQALSDQMDGWLKSNYYETWSGMFNTYFNPSNTNNAMTTSTTIYMGRLDAPGTINGNSTIDLTSTTLSTKIIVRAGSADDTVKMSVLPAAQGIVDGGKGIDTLDLSAMQVGVNVQSKAIIGANEALNFRAKTLFGSMYAYNFERLVLPNSNDTVKLSGADVPDLQEIDTGNGNSTIDSSVANLTINFGSGKNTLKSSGPGTIVEVAKGADTIEASHNGQLLVEDASTDDSITYYGSTLTGGVRWGGSESIYAYGINGERYGRNQQGDLVILDDDGNETFISGFNFGTDGTNRTAGLEVLQITFSSAATCGPHPSRPRRRFCARRRRPARRCMAGNPAG
jgi:hypothetical protein